MNKQESEDIQEDEDEVVQRILNMVMEYMPGAEVEYPESQDRKQFKIRLPTAANTVQQYQALRQRLGSRDAPRPKCRFQSCATAGAKFRYFNNNSSQTLQLRYRCLACKQDFTLGGRQNNRPPDAAAAANARRSTRLTTLLQLQRQRQQQQQQIHAPAAASVPPSLYPQHHHHHHHHYHHQFQLQLHLQQQQQQQIQLGIGPSSLHWAQGSSSSSAAENVAGTSAVHGEVQQQQGDGGNNNNNTVQDDQLNALLSSPAYGDLGTNIFTLLRDSSKDSNKK